MTEFVVEGCKGAGKGLMIMRMSKEYLDRGRPIAGNVNLFLEHLCTPGSRTTTMRLPDKPQLRDFELLGRGKPKGKPSEEFNGAIFLDECASWLNTRNYADPARMPMFEWFLHSRKRGWDVVYAIQSFDALDKQFRESFAEFKVSMWRLDRLPIPILGFVSRLLLGVNPLFPKVHIGGFYYGRAAKIKSYSKWVIGRNYYKAYDTEQIFDEHNEYVGLSTTLSSWHMLGRYQTRWQMYKGVFFSALLLGAFVATVLTSVGMYWRGFRLPDQAVAAKAVESQGVITGAIDSGAVLYFTTGDGQQLTSRDFARTATGYRAKVGNTIFSERAAK